MQRLRVRRQLVQGTASMASILVWGGDGGGAGETGVLVLGPP